MLPRTEFDERVPSVLPPIFWFIMTPQRGSEETGEKWVKGDKTAKRKKSDDWGRKKRDEEGKRDRRWPVRQVKKPKPLVPITFMLPLGKTTAAGEQITTEQDDQLRHPSQDLLKFSSIL